MNWGTAADAASRAWARRTQRPLEPHPSPGAAGTPAVQETRIRIPRQDATTMSGPEGPGACHAICHEEAPPGRPRGPGHPPRPRTGTRTGTQPLRARVPEAQIIPTRSSPAFVAIAAKLLLKNTPQVNRSGILMHTIRTGRTRTPNLMEHSTDSIDGKYFKSARDSHPATNLESILCGLEPDTNANIFKLYKHTPYFRNPSLPSVTSPIPHPCAPILHLHALPLR
jgi:hypothetical protein